MRKRKASRDDFLGGISDDARARLQEWSVDMENRARSLTSNRITVSSGTPMAVSGFWSAGLCGKDRRLSKPWPQDGSGSGRR